MSEYTIVGFAVSAVLFVALGYLVLRDKPSVRRMYLAMVLIGLGYLTATGAMESVGKRILGAADIAVPAESTADAPDAAPEAAAPAFEVSPATPASPSEAAPTPPAAETPADATPTPATP